jgi:peptidoglycan/LPS O-acetylase OafA/YrhL
LRHAHLAVDLFFALSGFVLGPAVRMSAAEGIPARLSLKGFFLRRLVRLHPIERNCSARIDHCLTN